MGLMIDETTLSRVPSNSIKYFFTSHFLEHVPPKLALALLKECYRCLEPGGAMRVTGPDMDKFTEVLLLDDASAKGWWESFWGGATTTYSLVDLFLNMGGSSESYGEMSPAIGHFWPSTSSIMIWFLVAAGFRPPNIFRSDYRASRFPVFQGPGLDNRATHSYFIDVMK
jgi:ubiquinone/menaquinone biosynthesis C-methylase UbiE